MDENGGQEGPDIVRQGLAQFAGMLPTAQEIASTSSSAVPPAVTSESAVPDPQTAEMSTSGKKRVQHKRKTKTASTGQSKASKRKPNRWADKCMYAELLEMSEDYELDVVADGIPQDIETGWVAVTPVPVGKRCLAVTHQTSGIPGVGEYCPPTSHTPCSTLIAHSAELDTSFSGSRKASHETISLAPASTHRPRLHPG